MSDIYKKREAMPLGGNNKPKKSRKRRASSRPVFDADHDRKRRSKNTGLRRFLHLSRKSDNEKFFWGSLGVVMFVVLAIIAIWQFVIVEQLVRKEEKKNDYIQYRSNIPERADSASE